MAYYVILANFTDQGIKGVKDTATRADAFKKLAAKAGMKVNTLLWTLGSHDLVVVAEAENDEAATAVSLSLAALGNVKTQTMRAFDATQMKAVLGKMV